jgi:MoaA/NifB/PqqE/SkfB family radical SAM enzyme
MTDRLFCAKPFEWFEVSHVGGRGEVYLCCPSWLDRPIGSLRRQSVAEIWNGAEAGEIRRSILDGSFDYCNASLCPYLQTRTGPVQPASEVGDERLRSALTADLRVLPWGPVKVICSYDRSCNLSCPSCRGETIVETGARDELLEVQRKIEQQALPQAEYLYITGSGDPFGSPAYRRWLRTVDIRRMPRLDCIHLHTNGLLWNRRMWSRIPPPTRSLIRSAEVSIDAATAATYAANRRGGDFRQMLRNLDFIAGLRREGPLRYLKISMVVQANNFQEMPAFLDLGRRSAADVVYFSRLVNWGTFSEGEFRERAVHLEDHARHRELIALLRSPELADPRVDAGNLTVVSGGPEPDRAALRGRVASLRDR